MSEHSNRILASMFPTRIIVTHLPSGNLKVEVEGEHASEVRPQVFDTFDDPEVGWEHAQVVKWYLAREHGVRAVVDICHLHGTVIRL